MGWLHRDQRGRIAGWVLALWVASSLTCTADEHETSDDSSNGLPHSSEGDGILQALQSLPDMEQVLEHTSPIPDTRFFTFGLRQPVDHHQPQGATFVQSGILIYRDRQAPTVFATAGYFVPPEPAYPELARILQANYVALEHRFFGASTPDPFDWTILTIEQAASDHHRLVLALRQFLAAKWVSSGASKGGMAAIYHRRFFPDDVDATLAYVAPNSYGDPDPRYVEFLASRGNPALWRRIDAWQQSLFDRWLDVRALFIADLQQRNQRADVLGIDTTLELAVLEAPFTMWQFGDASLAASVPATTASTEDLYGFLDRTSFGLADFWNDASLTRYAPYYYQAATELGYPQVRVEHLLARPTAVTDQAATFPPLAVSKPFDAAAMTDMQAWVDSHATRIMWIYGENDPYTAAAFRLSPSAKARDNVLYTVAAGNHGATLESLDASDRQAAYDRLGLWLNAPVMPTVGHDLRAIGSEVDCDVDRVVKRPH